MNKFKFRAECLPDVESLQAVLGDVSAQWDIEQMPPFPDVMVTLDTECDFATVRNAMKQVPDGHVMVETVANEPEYTGKRTYSAYE